METLRGMRRKNTFLLIFFSPLYQRGNFQRCSFTAVKVKVLLPPPPTGERCATPTSFGTAKDTATVFLVSSNLLNKSRTVQKTNTTSSYCSF